MKIIFDGEFLVLACLFLFDWLFFVGGFVLFYSGLLVSTQI